MPSQLIGLVALFLILIESAHGAVSLSELCEDVSQQTGGAASIKIMGRSYSKNVAATLEFFCNFADSPHSVDVDACENFIDNRFKSEAEVNVNIRGVKSSLSAVRSYCAMHKNVFTHHVCTVNGIKELAGWVEMEMTQFASLMGCHGIDEASLIMHFDEDGKAGHYQFIATHEKLYNCMMEKTKAAKEREDL